MNEALVENINAVVGVNDDLYHLGDFSFKGTREAALEIRKRIRCKKVHLVHGNHDKDWSRPEVEGAFIVEPMIKTLKIDRQKFVLSHFPLMDWRAMGHGSIHLHGHIHSVGDEYNRMNRQQGLFRYDVGVDANGFMPVSIEEILQYFNGVEPHGRVSWREWVSLSPVPEVEQE